MTTSPSRSVPILRLEGNITQAEAHLDELNNRLEGRRAELAMERHLAIGDIEHLGCAWVLPHPERTSPGIAPMVRDEEIERLAVQAVIRHETERGWVVESVEKENTASTSSRVSRTRTTTRLSPTCASR